MTTVKIRPLAAAIATLTTAALVAVGPAPAHAEAMEWQDGYSESDTLYNCITQEYSTGVTANVGWWSPTGQVPKVGETFYLRGYAGLIGLPCNQNGSVVVLPEIMLPSGFTFPDAPVEWGINAIDDATPTLGTAPVGVYTGVNGGIVLTADEAGEDPFEIRRGEIFEFRFPVVATREFKGTATQAPMCQLRMASDGPCQPSESGDHMQVAFFTAGHSSTQAAVIPYVPLFVAPATPPATPGTPVTPGTPATPGTPGSPIPGQVPSAPGAATATVKASYQVKAGRPGKAVVKIRGAKAPTGTVVVRDLAKGGKVIGKAKLTGRHRGTVTVRLAKLSSGSHQLVAEYLGSTDVKAAASTVKTLRLR